MVYLASGQYIAQVPHKEFCLAKGETFVKGLSQRYFWTFLTQLLQGCGLPSIHFIPWSLSYIDMNHNIALHTIVSV